VGVKFFLHAPLAKLSPHFQNRGAAHALTYVLSWRDLLYVKRYTGVSNEILLTVWFLASRLRRLFERQCKHTHGVPFLPSLRYPPLPFFPSPAFPCLFPFPSIPITLALKVGPLKSSYGGMGERFCHLLPLPTSCGIAFSLKVLACLHS